MTQSLYRPEALQAQHDTGLGKVHVATPLSFGVFVGFALLVALALVLFLTTGTYTRKARITGQLVPSTGLAKVQATQSGTIVTRHVAEGELVRQGQVLFTLSVDRSSITHGNTQAAIGQQIKLRRSSIRGELDKQQLISTQEEAALRKRLAEIDAEMRQVGGEIDNQQRRLQLAEQTVERFKGLAASGFMSEVQAQQKMEELLDQRARLQTLERNRSALVRDRSGATYELSVAPLKARQHRATLERNLLVLEQELTENEARREITVLAPQDGHTSNIQVESGQSVMAGAHLLAIVPAHAVLQAHLYAPSRSIGFIQPEARVLMRYQAFPYQKFGQHQGVVAVVSRTTLAPQDYAMAGLNALANEPLYRITVDLERQDVLAYGQPQALQPGMQVEADVLLDRRFIYEWILDPLYSVLGRV